jgi:hypothetical protein
VSRQREFASRCSRPPVVGSAEPRTGSSVCG